MTPNLDTDPDANDPGMIADLKELSEIAKAQIAGECPNVGRHTPAFRNLVFIRVCELLTRSLADLGETPIPAMKDGLAVGDSSVTRLMLDQV